MEVLLQMKLTKVFQEILSSQMSLQNDMGVIEEYEGEYSIENEFEPFVGQCFLSEEEAFIFYTTYASQHGFSIQKGRFVTKVKEIVRRDFFCHQEGKSPLKFVDQSKEQRNRKSLKCRCKAHLRIAL